MRAPLLLTLILFAVPGLAAANLTHAGCGTSTFSVGNSVRVDVWANNECVGAVAWTPNLACDGPVTGDGHTALWETHTLLLHATGCQTGALVGLP